MIEKIMKWLAFFFGWDKGEPSVTDEIIEEVKKEVKEPTAREILYKVSVESIGKEMSPQDLADDELACVESLEGVIKKAFGFYIGGDKPILATWLLLEALRKDDRFEEVSKGQAGDIILCPTGTGNGRIRGHVGILGNHQIMSNNSYTSLWDASFTHDTWYQRYEVRGDLDTHLFRIKV